jgi:hypothetical protein
MTVPYRSRAIRQHNTVSCELLSYLDLAPSFSSIRHPTVDRGKL